MNIHPEWLHKQTHENTRSVAEPHISRTGTGDRMMSEAGGRQEPSVSPFLLTLIRPCPKSEKSAKLAFDTATPLSTFAFFPDKILLLI